VPTSLPSSGTAIPTAGSTADGVLFPTVDLDAIDQVTAGRPLVTWRKEPEGWQATSAAGTLIPVDPAGMVRVITILSTLRYNRKLEDVNVTQFGLGVSGQDGISFTASGVVHRLRVGNSDPYSGAYYVQRDNDPAVYVVGSDRVLLLFSSLVVGTPMPTGTALTPTLSLKVS